MPTSPRLRPIRALGIAATVALLTAASSAVALPSAGAATPTASQYVGTALPPLAAGQPCTLNGVSSTGTAVGDAIDGSAQRVAVTLAPGATSLGVVGLPPTADAVVPVGINAGGDLVGDATRTNPPPLGSQFATWYAGGSWTDVNATVGPPQSVIVRAVNDSRIGVGGAYGFSGSLPTPIRWDIAQGTWQSVPGMVSVGGQAEGINAAGQIAGTRLEAPQRAFSYDPATNATTFSPTLGGSSASAMGISTDGVVVGSSSTSGGETHPFLWDPATGQMTDLGLPPGAASAVANGVNASHQVVGFWNVSGVGQGGAFLWDPVNGMQVLPAPLGASSAYASAIDDAGLIVGSVNPADSDVPQCAVWTPPAPPPSTASTTSTSTTATTTSTTTPVVVTPAFTG
ncbi:MAG: hypothetical protein U0Q07_00490 [Acidimicrobiales bacterium]